MRRFRNQFQTLHCSNAGRRGGLLDRRRRAKILGSGSVLIGFRHALCCVLATLRRFAFFGDLLPAFGHQFQGSLIGWCAQCRREASALSRKASIICRRSHSHPPAAQTHHAALSNQALRITPSRTQRLTDTMATQCQPHATEVRAHTASRPITPTATTMTPVTSSRPTAGRGSATKRTARCHHQSSVRRGVSLNTPRHPHD